MTENIKTLIRQLKSQEYKKRRRDVPEPDYFEFGDIDGFVANFKNFILDEVPIIHENDNFGFNISVSYKPEHVSGNYTPNYYKIISQGFDKICDSIRESMSKTNDGDKIEFGNAMIECIEAFLVLCDKYKDLAKEKGNIKLYNALTKVPHKAAESFYEALVFMKICTYYLRTGFTTHLGLGRFDQYIYPFYNHDKDAGVSDEILFEELEEFFISLNKDTDLYRGVQQGDNGQSMVLGGFDKDGNSMYNELSQMCMEASLELNLIDPKINLRVGKNTPDELYVLGTQLTKKGLGFPQYCNDDIVVPGLIKLGYDEDDALNYVVAACWEYIIPNCGVDVPNIDVLDYPLIVNNVITDKINECDTFEDLMYCVSEAIKADCDRMVNRRLGGGEDYLYWRTPVQSLFFDGCIESLTDVLHGGTKYRCFGAHGAGIANAADALAAVKLNVYDKKSVEKSELLSALEADFEGYDELRNKLRNSPKMGNNDDYVDNIACEIMGYFSKNLNNRDNGHRGIWRAGTGSAMEYLWRGSKCPATADGRKKGEPYSSSYSPSLDAKTAGVLSVIQSFTKYDLTEIINGGPLTIEIHDSTLRNDEGIKKVAMLVKNFVLLGGHQLQLNSVNREILLDAQKHPENHPNLIVRVWGWSGYFNELDVDYQNHIIRRTEYV